MATHASRNTATGLMFEDTISMAREGINLTKHNLYKYLTKKKIDYTKLISKKLLPDEAYFNPSTGELTIFEKSIKKPLVPLMKNLKLVHLKFINFEKLVKLLEQPK